VIIFYEDVFDTINHSNIQSVREHVDIVEKELLMMFDE
jgi:hypothetical protein